MRFWHSPTASVGSAPGAVLSRQKHRFLSFLGFTVTTPFETIRACRRLDENRTLACNERRHRQQNMLTRLAADSLYLIRAYFIYSSNRRKNARLIYPPALIADVIKVT